MKVTASLLSLAAIAAALTFGTVAAAQQPARAPTPAATTTQTADYIEQNLGGDQVLKFTGDELVGPANGAYGDVIRRPPGVIRHGLIRSRMNFVPELLKSVENL